MSYTLMIYLIGLITNLRGLAKPFAFFSALGVILAVVCTIALYVALINDPPHSDDDKKDAEMVKSWVRTARRITVSVFCVCMLLVIGLPRENTLNLMVATSVAETIAKTPTAQGLANDTVDVLRGFMKKAKDSLDTKE